ncbi:GNAT family N-acetyltransferase, partial [Phocaeicola vulgatus]|nr:GNAT family N-acetyltransferase [Phocaeicola vulgatus]
KVIILILWWRNFQLEYWRTFQLVSTYINDTIPELCMSLLKDFRNQGLGSLLIKRMLDDIKSLGYRHISLSVSKDNYAAGWYRKLGFKVYKEQKEDYIMIVDL